MLRRRKRICFFKFAAGGMGRGFRKRAVESEGVAGGAGVDEGFRKNMTEVEMRADLDL